MPRRRHLGMAVNAVWGRWRPPVSWFPGHMYKATKDMKERIKRCDLVIHLRDARVPTTSTNPNLDALCRSKTTLELFNKVDLVSPTTVSALQARCDAAGRSALFVSAVKRNRGLREVLQWLRAHADTRFKTAGALVMICGMPNVGKSTLINSLAGLAKNQSPQHAKKIALTGATPGVTRSLQSFQVSAQPVVRVLDTPGIFVPQVSDHETGLRLALAGLVSDGLVGEETLVEYLLFLAQSTPIDFSRIAPGLEVANGAVPDLVDLLDAVARPAGAVGKHPEERESIALRFVLRMFREGQLGSVVLDDVSQFLAKPDAPQRVAPTPASGRARARKEKSQATAAAFPGKREQRKAERTFVHPEYDWDVGEG